MGRCSSRDIRSCGSACAPGHRKRRDELYTILRSACACVARSRSTACAIGHRSVPAWKCGQRGRMAGFAARCFCLCDIVRKTHRLAHARGLAFEFTSEWRKRGVPLAWSRIWAPKFHYEDRIRIVPSSTPIWSMAHKRGSARVSRRRGQRCCGHDRLAGDVRTSGRLSAYSHREYRHWRGLSPTLRFTTNFSIAASRGIGARMSLGHWWTFSTKWKDSFLSTHL